MSSKSTLQRQKVHQMYIKVTPGICCTLSNIINAHKNSQKKHLIRTLDWLYNIIIHVHTFILSTFSDLWVIFLFLPSFLEVHLANFFDT